MMPTPPSSTTEIVPFAWFERSLHGWWIIVITTILGGWIGLAIHSARPPLYEAKAHFSFHLDLTRTGYIEQNDEEIAFSIARNLIASANVRDQVIAAAKKQHLALSPEQFLRSSTIERYNETFELRYRDPNPQTAATVTNLWAESAYSLLKEASEHARQAYILQNHIDALENCLERSLGPETGQANCSLRTVHQMQTDMQASLDALNTEMLSSHGLTYAFVFDLSDTALVPSRPVANDRNTFALAGALIGLLSGISAILMDIPTFIARRFRRA